MGNATVQPLVVTKLTDPAPDIRVVTFAAPDGAALSDWDPGSHIAIRFGGTENGEARTGFVRHYSLCGDTADRASWTIAVLRENGGRGGSEYVHTALTVGETVTCENLHNAFPFAPSGPAVLVAGGIGITPLIPMIAAADAAGVDWTLVYGGRTHTAMAFADQLRCSYPGRVQLVAEDTDGRVDVTAVVDSAVESGADLWCCGPAGLIDAVESAGRARSVTVHSERFRVDAPGTESGSFTVEIESSGDLLTVPADRSLLEVLQNEGFDVDSSCEEGTCGTCEIAVLAGDIDHRDGVLSDTERASGTVMLPCVSRALAGSLRLDL